jgi:hypothetical protein
VRAAGDCAGKSAPDQHSEDNWHEERVADAQMRDGCAPEIAGQQDCAENGSLWNHIDDRSGELENSKPDRKAFGKSKMSETFHDGRRLDQFHDCAHEQQ